MNARNLGGKLREERSPSTRRKRKDRKGHDASRAIGNALRSVYDDMLREEVPPCFLDLLGKLD